ncbi:MAG: hypothetical protein JST86_13655 [Bacteroidetes bacterium]|nr:hypothetical protein [Bacteroidota bacterium]
MKRIILYSTVILLCSSCGFNFSNSKASLPGTWLLYDATPGKSDHDFSTEANLKQQVSDGDQYCFFSDGSYTEITGKTNYTAGTWKMSGKDDALIITPFGAAPKQLHIALTVTADKKERFSLELSHNGITMKFVKEYVAMDDMKNDPYYKDNNTWRIKPAHAETDTEITERLANYIKHMALILKAANDRKQQVVSFERSMGPIKIYNGGIGIHSFGIVPDSWKQCFYNDADALKAYDMYNQSLTSSSYRGASSGSWFVDDYNIMLSVYNEIHPGK